MFTFWCWMALRSITLDGHESLKDINDLLLFDIFGFYTTDEIIVMWQDDSRDTMMIKISM